MDIWNTMDQSIQNGCLSTEEYLPGSLKVRRRAPVLYNKLLKEMYPQTSSKSIGIKNSLPRPLPKDIRKSINVLDVISVYAIAVNEENAAGGRIVTAPTNGASGVIPAVLKYYLEFISERNVEKDIMDFLFTSAAIGMLYKKRASISAAEVINKLLNHFDLNVGIYIKIILYINERWVVREKSVLVCNI